MNFSKIEHPDMRETLFVATHKSGMKIYVLPKAGFTKSYAVLATRYGSVNTRFCAPGDDRVIDIPDGTAHYLEHKMFDQADGSSVFDRFSEYGADANAFTSFAMTAYLFSAASHFYENLKILFDYTMHPYYTDETVEKERGIIGQEIRMYEDDPDWNVYFNALRAMYRKNPVNIDIAGTVESIAEITKDTLYTCYRTFYHPSNMVFFCIGAVTPESVGDVLDAVIPDTEDPGSIRTFFPEEPEENAAAVIKKEYAIGTPQFVVAYKSTTLPKEGKDALSCEAKMSLLCEIVGGKDSALYNRLYAENLINDSFDASYEGELSYAFSAFSGESHDPDAVYRAISDEVSRLQSEGIDDAVFERAKRVCYGRAVSLFDRQEDFANAFIRFAAKNADLISYPAVISGITKDDVLSCLAEWKTPVLSAIYPKGALNA